MQQIADTMQNQKQELQIENLTPAALDQEFQKTLDDYNARHPPASSTGLKTKTALAGTSNASNADGNSVAEIPGDLFFVKHYTSTDRQQMMRLPKTASSERNQRKPKPLLNKRKRARHLPTKPPL